MTKSRIASLITLFALVLVITAQMYVLNSQTSLCRDDYSYSYTFAVTENKFRIENFRQVIESQINHYRVLNGRAVTHTLAQTFLIFDKYVFDIFNTAAFVALLLLISFHASPERRCGSPVMLLAAFIGLWFFTPAFGDSYLWLTGACNYLWGIFIILLYLIPQSAAYSGVRAPALTTRIVLTPLYFILAVIAGATNENTGAALIVMSLLFIVANALKHRRYPFMSTVGLVGNILGFLFMILAPGQSARLESSGGFGNIAVWLERFKNISEDFFKYHKLFMLVLVILIVVAIVRKVKLAKLIRPLIFLVGTLASVYSMILSPYFPARVWSGPTVLFTLTLISFASAVLPEQLGRRGQVVVCVICCMLGYVFAQSYEQAYKDITAVKSAVEARIEVIEEHKAQGISKVALENICDNSRFTPYVDFGELNDDPKTWPNTAIAMYFGLDEVRKK
ncbi:MAG: hypothetical protein IJ391_08020 [Clostridia bacterium]|nr:hypothetical protein [Clostridia bacterium]